MSSVSNQDNFVKYETNLDYDLHNYNGTYNSAALVQQDDIMAYEYLEVLKYSTVPGDQEMYETAIKAMSDTGSTEDFKGLNKAAEAGTASTQSYLDYDLTVNDYKNMYAAFDEFNAAYPA